MNPRDIELTREMAMQRLDYNPNTGEFRWKEPGTNRVKVGTIAGHVGVEGYRRITIARGGGKQKRVMAHRIAWLIVHGEWPVAFVDHIDGNKTNNRIDNLRLATRSQNRMNTPIRADNTTGHKGVFISKNPNRAKKYVAQIAVDGKQRTIGYFLTLDEAVAARTAAVAVLHGKFGRS
jgi:hypothetical protein